MFDIGATELLLIFVVAVLVIGPKDMPLAFRTVGRWIGRMRKLSNHFRTGLDAMIREAELEDMEEKWKAQNEKIMRDHPDAVSEVSAEAQMQPLDKPAADVPKNTGSSVTEAGKRAEAPRPAADKAEG